MEEIVECSECDEGILEEYSVEYNIEECTVIWKCDKCDNEVIWKYELVEISGD